MAEALKVLGQSSPSGSTLTDLYTVPAATQAAVSSVFICNRDFSPATFRLSVAVAGAADDVKQYLYYDQAIPANSTFIATVGVALATTDVLRCYGSSGSLSFSAFGCEVT